MPGGDDEGKTPRDPTRRMAARRPRRLGGSDGNGRTVRRERARGGLGADDPQGGDRRLWPMARLPRAGRAGLRPVRRANLAELRLGTSFVETATGYSIHLAAAQMKNRRPFEIDVPDTLRVYFDRYLDAIRPCFPRANQHNGLWASLRGVPMSGDAIYNRVVLHTGAAFGNAIYLHLFRAISATTIAVETPRQVRAAAALLGHASLTTTHHHYIQANMVEASRRYGNLIEKLRAGKLDPA